MPPGLRGHVPGKLGGLARLAPTEAPVNPDRVAGSLGRNWQSAPQTQQPTDPNAPKKPNRGGRI